jgi:branched-chain amino acid transport system substrate-binding protein
MIQSRFLFLVGLLIAFIAGSVIIEAQTLHHSHSSPTTKTVNIGLLVPEPDAVAAKHGAELAIRQANSNSSYSGLPFHLIFHSVEGPWGTGSKLSVKLVFDDEVVALMGSLDGRNAHLVEQVATKSRVLFLSTWASEMTLSQAFVPWYFRCVPNDHQQAVTLIQEIYKKRKITNVAVIGAEDFDSEVAVASFIRTADSMKIKAPRQFVYRSSTQDFQMTLEEIDKYDSEAVILFGKPALASAIIPMLKQRNMNVDIFGSLSIMDDQKAKSPDWKILEGITLVSSGHWFTEEGIAFQKAFQKAYGYQPGAAAAYAYDGVNMIIEFVKKYGPDRNKMIELCAETNYKTGVTGEIRFDGDGNRIDIPGLMTVKNGKPVRIIKMDE